MTYTEGDGEQAYPVLQSSVRDQYRYAEAIRAFIATWCSENYTYILPSVTHGKAGVLIVHLAGKDGRAIPGIVKAHIIVFMCMNFKNCVHESMRIVALSVERTKELKEKDDMWHVTYKPM